MLKKKSKLCIESDAKQFTEVIGELLKHCTITAGAINSVIILYATAGKIQLPIYRIYPDGRFEFSEEGILLIKQLNDR